MSHISIEQLLAAHPAAHKLLTDVLTDPHSTVTGDELVDEVFDVLVADAFQLIGERLRPESLSPAQAELLIRELSVFARYNSPFLHRAAKAVEGACLELAHEFERNRLEEGGERGKLPSHFILYSSAVGAELGLLVNGHLPERETETLIVLHDLLVASDCPSTICGGYYATEGVAIDETIMLRRITSRYAEAAIGKHLADLPRLTYYFELHLDEAHEAAEGDVSVEQGHIDGIARFIRQSDLFGLELPRVADGFLQILAGMFNWWDSLTQRVWEGAQ